MSLIDSLLGLIYCLPPRWFGRLIRPVHRLFARFPHSMEFTAVSDYDPDGLEVKSSTIPDAGNGLFTTRMFNEGDCICEYAGTELSLFELLRTADWSYIYAGDEAWIDAKPHKNVLARYINDNFDESQLNCHFCDEEKVCIRALRDIEPGEELFAEYGEYYWAVVQ